MRHRLLVFLFCVFVGSSSLLPVSARALAVPATRPANTPEQNTHYQNGKLLLDQGNYALAMKEFEPLTKPAARFERAPEAAYLYAVAATRARKWAEAEQMLNLLRTEYATWPGLPDALYLQAQVSFEQNDPDNALATLQKLPPDQLAAERAALESNYLARFDRPQLDQLRTRYPKDAALGRLYADKLVAGWYTPADKPLLDQLVKQFSLDKTRYAPRAAAAKKSTYSIAVLLPFEFNDPAQARRNQFVTDLYAGLRLAQDSLQRAGRPVQLFAYDTGADTLQLQRVLALPELAGMDMIIGPVYKSGSKLVARYARQKQIITVNPLSQDRDLVRDNAWHYLYEPSTATQGEVAARFALGAFAGRTAAVLYENTRDETAFALSYKAAYEAGGGKVQLRRISSATDSLLVTSFAGLNLKTVGHLVVASDALRAGPFTLKQLRTQNVRLPLLTYASWLDNERVSLSELDSRGVYLLYPHYLDPVAPGVLRFRQLYAQQYHLPPSVFASIGFELLYYFGSRLHEYGPGFQPQLAASGPVSGALFQGIGYPNGAHDNQYVPVTKLEHLEIEVLNPVGGLR